MSIECYEINCPHHTAQFEPYIGPFCNNDECTNTAIMSEYEKQKEIYKKVRKFCLDFECVS